MRRRSRRTATPRSSSPRGGEVAALAWLGSLGVSLVAEGAYLHDPVFEATIGGHVAMLTALIDAGNTPRDAHLREATMRGDDAIRALLLARGASPLAHRTPADAARANDVWAIRSMRAEGREVADASVLTQAVGMGHSRVVMDLLEHGARLDGDKGTLGPLQMAVDRANADVALALVERGAALDAKDPHGNTPLFTACMRRGMERPIEAMIARGANPHEVMRHGSSAWKLTETMPAYRALLAKTARVPDPSPRGWEPPKVSRVLTDPALRQTFEEAYRGLFEELVPPRDAAPTVQGELARVSNKLWDEAMRNGNFERRHRTMAKVFDALRGAPFDDERERKVRGRCCDQQRLARRRPASSRRARGARLVCRPPGPDPVRAMIRTDMRRVARSPWRSALPSAIASTRPAADS